MLRRLASPCHPLFVVAALLSVDAPDSAPPTQLVMHSQPGDYIGAGANWLHTPADGSFQIERNFDNGVTVRYQDFPDVCWYLDFAAPNDALLTPGTYELATRFPFHATSDPGLSVSGTGRGCNMLTGRFTVLEVVYGAGSAVTSFAANFEQHCEGMAPALFGSVRFNAAARPAHTVTIATNGSGGGTVTSFPAGLDCGVTCAAPVPDGLVTALIATPAAGSGFAGWSGPAECSDGVIAEPASITCTATFIACSYSIAPTALTGSANGGSGTST